MCIKSYVFLFFTAFFILSSSLFSQGKKKVMNVGEIRWEIVDQADEGEGSWGWGQDKTFSRGYEDDFESTKCLMMASKNWTDTTGVVHEIKVSGHGMWEVDDERAMMPVPDAEGATIRRYYKYQPPAIMVGGLSLEDPFPLNSTDEVAPHKIPGNSDGMIESFINTDMGVSIHHRAIAYAQQNHDQYLITEYTFKNTGNVDLDDDIELPDQVIEDFYFLKNIRPHEWQKPWCSVKGIYPGEDLRIIYGYPSRDEGSDYDNLGVPDVDNGSGNLQNTSVAGEALLFASLGPGADFNTNDPNQPHATGYFDVDFTSFTFHSRNMTRHQIEQLYEVMQFGAVNIEGINWPLLTGTKPGYHGIPLDERGFAYPNEMEGFGFSSSVAWSAGPYTLQPGDSIKIVIAKVYGNISPQVAYQVGQDWLNDDAHFGDDIIGGATDILPPQYQAHPELYAADVRSELTNWAKDNWVYSGIDSMFQNAKAALFAYNNDYVVPEAPPAPSITVESSSLIKISWGMEAEAAEDLAGYRIYRSKDRWWAGIEYGETVFFGGWELIAEVDVGVNEYLDNVGLVEYDTQYFYAVTAIDDGLSNGTHFDGQVNQPLESNIAANATQIGVERLRPRNVYPGDTDNNGIVNALDVLAIGVYFLESGHARQSISFDWQLYEVEYWTGAYADANGDGLVNEIDVIGIGVNWGKTWSPNGQLMAFDPSDSILINQNIENFQIIYNSLKGDGPAIIEIRKLLKSILKIDDNIPDEFSMQQNYPNPFNGQTTIRFDLPIEKEITLTIYNIAGQVIDQPIKKTTYQAGSHTFNMDSSLLSSGIYFYQLETDVWRKVRKMMVLK